MVSTGSVTDSTVVMTIVHDCQVVDLPDDLFGPTDVPVDYIVTPTRVIFCADHQSEDGHRPSKPSSIIWSLLRPSNLERIPVLQRIRYREWKAGKDVRLSDEETDPTDLEDVIVPESDASSRGDYKKPLGLARNQDRNVQKLHKEKVTAVAGQPELNGGINEDNDTSTKPAADDRKMFRCATHSCILCC